MPAQRFPLFRKTPDGRHFYRIESNTVFVEIQKVGRRHAIHRIEARAYPELVRIAEMIDGADGRFARLEAEEWDALYARM